MPAKDTINKRRAIALRLPDDEHHAVTTLANEWGCSLSQAAARLVRQGLQQPEQAPADERVLFVRDLIVEGKPWSTIYPLLHKKWRLTQGQAQQLLNQAREELVRDCEIERHAANARERLAMYQAAAKVRDQTQLGNTRRQ